MQIHNPAYFSDIGEIVTEIEFDDLSDRWPNNPDAQNILKRMHERLPDLLYREAYALEPSPVGSVSELIGR